MIEPAQAGASGRATGSRLILSLFLLLTRYRFGAR